MTPEFSQEKKKLPIKTSENQPNPHEEDKTILVERGNGEITTMRLADETQRDEKGRRIAYIVDKEDDEDEEYISGHKPLLESSLTPARQAELADQLAISKLGAEEFNRLAAERAQQLLAMQPEAVVDSPEAEEELREDAAEDMAEIAVEGSVEIEDEAAQVAEPEKFEDLDLLAAELNSRANKIDDAAREFDNDIKAFESLHEDADQLRKIAYGLEGTYGLDAARTLLKNIQEGGNGKYGLHNKLATVRNAEERDAPEMQRAITAVKETLKRVQSPDFTNETVGAVETVRTPDNVVDLQQRVSTLRNVMSHIENVIAQSYNAGINEGELIVIATQLDQLAKESGNLMIAAKLQPHLTDLKGSIIK